MKYFLLKSKNNDKLYYQNNIELDLTKMKLTEIDNKDLFTFSEEEIEVLKRKYTELFNLLIEIEEVKDEKLEQFLNEYCKILSTTHSKIDALSFAKEIVYGEEDVDDDILLSYVFCENKDTKCEYCIFNKGKENENVYVLEEELKTPFQDIVDSVDRDIKNTIKNLELFIKEKRSKKE